MNWFVTCFSSFQSALPSSFPSSLPIDPTALLSFLQRTCWCHRSDARMFASVFQSIHSYFLSYIFNFKPGPASLLGVGYRLLFNIKSSLLLFQNQRPLSPFSPTIRSLARIHRYLVDFFDAFAGNIYQNVLHVRFGAGMGLRLCPAFLYLRERKSPILSRLYGKFPRLRAIEERQPAFLLGGNADQFAVAGLPVAAPGDGDSSTDLRNPPLFIRTHCSANFILRQKENAAFSFHHG